MGRQHLSQARNAGMTPKAVCDVDPARAAAGAADFPGIKTCTDYHELLEDPGVDVVVCILPHNLHGPVCLDIVKAGKHCVCEKPFTLTVAEADAIIAAANQTGAVMSVYHNRRWDHDIRAIRDIVQSGEIGEIFQIEIGAGHYGHPGYWWRSEKSVSGGNLYDWGVHYIDWMLQLIPDPIRNVTGFYRSGVWSDVTNEDHTQAVIRFATNKLVDVQISHTAAPRRPHMRILGTEGGILYPEFNHKFTVYRYDNGKMWERHVDAARLGYPDPGQAYYNALADCLLNGAPNPVTPESARRNIAVIEAAERSSKSGLAEPVAHEQP